MSWQIEEVGTGKTSETCLMVIDRFADIAGVANCSRALCSPDIRHMHIVFDDKISPMRVQAYLQTIRHIAKSEMRYTIKHADILIIRLMGYLWERAKAQSRKKGNTDANIKM